MSVLDSLPDRPLTDAELASLNRADVVTLAVDVTEAEETTPDDIEGLLLGTDRWLKGLVYDGAGDGWRVVATEELGETERFDAMQACEDAVRAALDERDD
jgi:hypothetical protein